MQNHWSPVLNIFCWNTTEKRKLEKFFGCQSLGDQTGYTSLPNCLDMTLTKQKFITKLQSTSRIFSLFYNRCQKRDAKNLWKWVFRASRRVSFLYFPNVAADDEGCPTIPFRIFVDVIISIPYETSKMKPFVTKNS